MINKSLPRYLTKNLKLSVLITIVLNHKNMPSDQIMKPRGTKIARSVSGQSTMAATVIQIQLETIHAPTCCTSIWLGYCCYSSKGSK